MKICDFCGAAEDAGKVDIGDGALIVGGRKYNLCSDCEADESMRAQTKFDETMERALKH